LSVASRQISRKAQAASGSIVVSAQGKQTWTLASGNRLWLAAYGFRLQKSALTLTCTCRGNPGVRNRCTGVPGASGFSAKVPKLG